MIIDMTPEIQPLFWSMLALLVVAGAVILCSPLGSRETRRVEPPVRALSRAVDEISAVVEIWRAEVVSAFQVLSRRAIQVLTKLRGTVAA